MKYECVYNPDLNTIEVSTHGIANMSTLTEMVHSIADLSARQKTANILINHTELDVSLLTMSDIEILSQKTVSVRDIVRMRKCAHVVAKDHQFGLVRAWEIMIETKGFTDIETRLFKDREEAIQWIT